MDILLNNAGILRDVSFKNMSDEDWDLVIKVHVKGAYKVGHAFRVIYDGQLRFLVPVCQSCMATFSEAKPWPDH